MNNNDKKLYKDYFYNVKPSPKLVAETKRLMKAEEQKKSHKQKNVFANPALVGNFRQYGSFVVSLVFALSVTLNVTEINPSLPTAPLETTTEETFTTATETTELTSTSTPEKTEPPITTLDTVVTERQTDSIVTTVSETENSESSVITNEIIVITDDNTNTTTLDISQEENLTTSTSKTTSATSTVTTLNTTTITSVTVPTTTVKETTITKPETISVTTTTEITEPEITSVTTTPRFTNTTPQITTTTPRFTATEETITITQPTTITSDTDNNVITTTTIYETNPTTNSESIAETTIYNSDLQSYVINLATDILYTEYDNYGNTKTYTYEELKEIFGGNFLPDEFLTDNVPYNSAITFADKEVSDDDNSGLIYFYGNYDETFSSPFIAVRINLATRFNFLNTFMFDHKTYYYSESYGFIRQLQIYKISDNIFSDDLSTYIAEFNILRDEMQIDFQVTASQVSISQFIATLEKFFERLEYK